MVLWPSLVVVELLSDSDDVWAINPGSSVKRLLRAPVTICAWSVSSFASYRQLQEDTRELAAGYSGSMASETFLLSTYCTKRTILPSFNA